MKDHIDNHSFIHVRLCTLLSKGQRKCYQVQGNGRGTVITMNPDYGKHNLRELKEKLEKDPDTMARYTLSWDPEANEIRLGFRAGTLEASQYGLGGVEMKRKEATKLPSIT